MVFLFTFGLGIGDSVGADREVAFRFGQQLMKLHARLLLGGEGRQRRRLGDDVIGFGGGFGRIGFEAFGGSGGLEEIQ